MRSGMLSRIAESLFWIGRYVERADDTARILDAFLASLLEGPWADEDIRCRSLLAILGVVAPENGRLTTGDALDLLAFDRANPSAITGALAAARDNSGYLYPSKESNVGDTVQGQSHAWVEYFDGGWHGHDPTNGIPADHRHVLVARGRDYADVPPLKGVYNGAPSSHLGVTVEITRLA